MVSSGTNITMLTYMDKNFGGYRDCCSCWGLDLEKIPDKVPSPVCGVILESILHGFHRRVSDITVDNY